MTITITLKEAVNSVPALISLGAMTNLDSLVTWNIGKVISKLSPPTDSYTRIKDNKLKEVARKDESGNPIIIDKSYDINWEVLKSLESELEELLKEPIEIKVKQIPFSMFKDKGISAGVFASCDWLIVEDEQEAVSSEVN